MPTCPTSHLGKSHPRRPSARWLALSAALGLAMGLAGCQAERQRAAESDSILALLPPPPTPAQAAAWAGDPHDPDKRFRGTLLLSNAPWGGEGVYLRLYRAQLGAVEGTTPDADPSVRAAAAFALGLHGSPDEDVPTILPLLEDEDRFVRFTAVRSLQRLHNPVAIPALAARIDPKNETDPEIRAEAADALGQYPNDRAFQALILALGDPRFAVTNNARKSLQTITGKDFADDRRAWLTWAEQQPAQTRFALATPYVYPAFSRDKGWLEYLPFFPTPARNEVPGNPAGLVTPAAASTPEGEPQPATS